MALDLMRVFSVLAVALLSACAVVRGSESVETAVADRILIESGSAGERPIFISNPASCVAPRIKTEKTVSLSDLEVVDSFNETYPSGVYILCDLAMSGSSGTAKVHRILHHQESGTLRVAKIVRVKLERTAGNWEIVEWSATAIDYGP